LTFCSELRLAVVAIAENVKENTKILLFAREATGSTVTPGLFGGVAIVDGRAQR
jgi:hypothetical protein